jgi:Rrf2 family iron-sulfur cluster assembly transcriptional regulator
MKLTTKGRYAVTAMLDLALHLANAPVKLTEISQRQNISLSYLEQLFARLRKANLVKSTRGPGGGYALAREAADISIADIILSVDEDVDTTLCKGSSNCLNQQQCLTHELWESLSSEIYGFLSGISLSSIAQTETTRSVASRQDNEQLSSIEIQQVSQIN